MGTEFLVLCFYERPEDRLDIVSEADRIIQLMQRMELPISHIGLGGPASSGKLVGKQAALLIRPSCVEDSCSIADGVFLEEADDAVGVVL
jgi:hypothetical protein